MGRIKIKELLKGNGGIWAIIGVMFAFSTLSVFSASVQLPGSNTTVHLFKHLSGLIFGILCIYAFHRVPGKYLKAIFLLLFGFSLLLLFLTLFAPEVNGARRWIFLGPISIQTSDFAKVTLIAFLANQLAYGEDSIDTVKSFFIKILLPIALTCGLILPSNLSTALLVFFESLIVIFFSRIRKRYSCGLVVISIVAGGMLYFLIMYGNLQVWRFPTWKARIESFVGDSEDNAQKKNARIAVASGGIVGCGPGNGKAKVKLANAHCDYIFANIVEEYGIVGSTFVIWLYVMLFSRGISIVKKINKLEPGTEKLPEKYRYRQYLVLGLTSMIVIQALSNMFVATDLMPVTGQTLPFISYGTSSLVFIGFAIGTILCVSREVEDELKKIEKSAVANIADSKGETISESPEEVDNGNNPLDCIINKENLETKENIKSIDNEKK